MIRKQIVLAASIILLILTGSPAHAKGLLQMQGTMAEVTLKANVISFQFTGSIQFTARVDGTTHIRDLAWKNRKIPVTIRNWTIPYKPDLLWEKAQLPGIHMRLQRLAQAGKSVEISVDNPSLTFSNEGELTSISGTHVYAEEVPPPAK